MNRQTASALALIALLAGIQTPAAAGNDDLVSPFGAKAKSQTPSGAAARTDRTRGDLISPFGAKGQQHREPRVSGRDHRDHLAARKHDIKRDHLKKKIILSDRKIDHKLHRDHLAHKRRLYDRRYDHRYDRLKDRLFDHYAHKRYDRDHYRHRSDCRCSLCVRTRTKIVIAPRPDYHRTTTRTVIVRPTYDELYAASPWDLLSDWRFERALDRFSDLASDHSRRGEYKIGYALAALGLGERDLAATAFRRALDVDPSVMTRFRADARLDRVVRDLEREIDRLVRRDAYDTDAVFLLASLRMLRTDILDLRDLEHDDYAMLRDSDRDLLKHALPNASDPYRD